MDAPPSSAHASPLARQHVREDVIARLRAAGCVFAEVEADLLLAEAPDDGDLERMVALRVEGLPLEHVLGWAEFCGHRIPVAPEVFVPRPRTELLAREAISLVRPGSVVLDLCCGSGALGLVVALAHPDIELHSVDIDPRAAECAASNLSGVGGQVYAGDLFDPLPERLRGRVDLIVANAPYVPTCELATLPHEARSFEPQVALDGGACGTQVQREIALEARTWLAPGGWLLVETGAHQVDATTQWLTDGGLAVRVESSDDEATVVLGQRTLVATGTS